MEEHMQFERPNTDPKAPEGKIRFIGTEHGKDFFIGDYDEPLTSQELDRIAHENRGVGIEVYAYDSDGKCVHSA